MIHTTTNKQPNSQHLRPRWPFAHTEDDNLTIESANIEFLAHKFGTPFYLIVESNIRDKLRQFKKAFDYAPFKPQYAIKCNSNIEILKIVREEGFEADASSVGEIILALLAGFRPDQITLTNLYKSEKDLMLASRIGVKAITVDSIEELRRAIKVANDIETPMNLFIRINPKIESGSYKTTDHQYGIPIDQAKTAIQEAARSPNVDIVGIHWHGAYVPSPEIYVAALKKIFPLLKAARQAGCSAEYLDLGGGFPVEYGDKEVFKPEDVGNILIPKLKETIGMNGMKEPTLVLEPGKFIVANSGIGVMKVVSIKDFGTKKIAVVDGSTYAMLPDPLIWDCKYNILPANKMTAVCDEIYDIHGCTCDYLDRIGKEKKMPKLMEGDILAVMDTGAYSNVIASNFNTLKRPQMLMLKEDGQVQIIRRTDRYSEMFAAELEVTKTCTDPTLKNIYNLIRNAASKTAMAKLEKENAILQ